MPLNFVLDDAAVQDRLTNMASRIGEVEKEGIPGTLIDWQREDMKRNFTNVDTDRPGSWFTLIWPRSRTYDEKHRSVVGKVRRRRQLSAMPRLKGTITGKRPILRPALFDVLVERMNTLLDDVLSWSKAKSDGG